MSTYYDDSEFEPKISSFLRYLMSAMMCGFVAAALISEWLGNVVFERYALPTNGKVIEHGIIKEISHSKYGGSSTIYSAWIIAENPESSSDLPKTCYVQYVSAKLEADLWEEQQVQEAMDKFIQTGFIDYYAMGQRWFWGEKCATEFRNEGLLTVIFGVPALLFSLGSFFVVAKHISYWRRERKWRKSNSSIGLY